MSIFVEYYSFNTERADNGWKNFPDDAILIKKHYHDTKIPLNERQKGLKDNLHYDINHLIDEAIHDQAGLKEHFKSLDLYYGSITNKPFEDSKMAQIYLEEILIPEFLLQCNENNFPLGSELVRFYDTLNKEKVLKFANLISNYFESENIDSVLYATNFLLQLKPVIDDLKNNPSSILVSSINGDIYDNKNNELLENRLENHIRVFKKIFLITT